MTDKITLDVADPFAQQPTAASPQLDVPDPFSAASLPAAGAAPAKAAGPTGSDQKLKDAGLDIATGVNYTLAGTLGFLDTATRPFIPKVPGVVMDATDALREKAGMAPLSTAQRERSNNYGVNEAVQDVDTAVGAAVRGENPLTTLQRASEGNTGLQGQRPNEVYNDTLTATTAAKSEYQRGKEQELSDTKGFWASAAKVVTEPTLLKKFLLEQVPNLLTMGAGTRGTAIAATEGAIAKGVGGEAAKDIGLATAAKQSALYEAQQEGGQAGQQNEAEILAMPLDQLALVPAFAEMVQAGVSPEEARRYLGQKSALYAAPIGFVAGLVGAKISAPFEAKLFTQGLDVRGLSGLLSRHGAAEVARDVAKEGAEEFVQEGGSQIGQNIGAMQTTDPNRTLLQGVPEAAGAGAALGGVLGGGMATTGIVASRPQGPLERVASAAAGQQRQYSAEADAAQRQAAAAAAFPHDDPQILMQELRARATDPALKPAERQQALTELQALVDMTGTALPGPGGFTVDSQGVATPGIPNPVPEIAAGARLPGPFGAGLDRPAPRRQGADSDSGTGPQESGVGAGGNAGANGAGAADAAGGLPGQEPAAANSAGASDGAGPAASPLSYDESPKQVAGDVMPPSGEPFRSRGAAGSAAKRIEGAKVFPLEGGGFVVRRPRAGEAQPGGAAAPQGSPAPTGDLPAGQSPAADAAASTAQPSAPAKEPAGPPAAEGQAETAGTGALEASPAGGATSDGNDSTAGLNDAQPAAIKATADALAHAANVAATSHANDAVATDAMKEAGNYKKGHVRVNGLDLSIENAAGTKRNPEWPTLQNHYGYVKGSVGADGDHVDAFISARAGDPSLPVFVIDQHNKDGSFDEHKVMLGFADEATARAGYLENYTPDWNGLGGIKQMSLDEFKAWVKDPAQTKVPVTSGFSTSNEVAKQEVAPGETGTGLAQQQQLFAQMDGKTVPIDSLEQGSEKFRQYIAAADGSPVVSVVDQDGKTVGHFNQHGDVVAGSHTDADPRNPQLLYRTPDEKRTFGTGNGKPDLLPPHTMAVHGAGYYKGWQRATVTEGPLKGVSGYGRTDADARTDLADKVKDRQKVLDARGAPAAAPLTADEFKAIDGAARKEMQKKAGIAPGLAWHYMSDEQKAALAPLIRATLADEAAPATETKAPGPETNPPAAEPAAPETDTNEGDGETEAEFQRRLDASKSRDKAARARISTAMKDGRFKAAFKSEKGANEPDSLSEPAQHFLDGWEDAKAGKPLDTARLLVPTEEMKPFGFNPVDSYRSGWGSYTAGRPMQFRTMDNVDQLLKAAGDVDLAANGEVAEPENTTTPPAVKTEAAVTEKPAKAKKAPTDEQALRAARVDAHTTLTGDPQLQAAALKDDGRATFDTAARAAITVYADAVAAEGNPPAAVVAAIRALADNTEFMDQLFKKARRVGAEQEKAAARNPEARAAALAAGLEKAGIEPGPRATWFEEGFDHMLAGKTKSTLLPGDGQTDQVSGYLAAQAWARAGEGKAWYEGKRWSKLENTGVDLRRWFDTLKKQAEGTPEHMAQTLLRMTSRSTLFPIEPKEGATPGTTRMLELLRERTATFGDYFTSWAQDDKRMPLRGESSNNHGGYTLPWMSGRGKIEEALAAFIERVTGSDFLAVEDKESGLVSYRLNSYNDNTASHYPLKEIERDDVREIILGVARDYMKMVESVRAGVAASATAGEVIDKLYQATSAEQREAIFNGRRRKGRSFKIPSREGREEKQILADEAKPLEQGSQATPLRRPRLDRIERTGPPVRTGDVTPQVFKDTFGFADVGFGTWVGAKADQDHLNYAYDAFADLARLLNIPAKGIGLSGLHFTIGALGHGRHAAHYQHSQPSPSGAVRVINVTNTKGDGTVAHEWGHALDYWLRGLSNAPDARQVVQEIKAALIKSQQTIPMLQRAIDSFLMGQMSYSHLRNDPIGSAAHAFSYYSTYGEPTQFKKDADQLGADYWGNEVEPWARSFEAWVFDRMVEQQQSDNYLVSGWVKEGVASKENGYRGTAYPHGSERELFAGYWDALAGALVVDEDGKVNVDRAAFDAAKPRVADSVAGLDYEAFQALRKEMTDYTKLKERRIRLFAERAAAMTEQREAEEARKAELAVAEAAQRARAEAAPASLSEAELEALFDDAESELAEAAQEPPRAPVQGEEWAPRHVATILKTYEDGSEEVATVRDLADEIETMLTEGLEAPELQTALDTWNDELEDDRQLGGRGDLDAAEETLLSSIRSYVDAQKAPASDKAFIVPTRGADGGVQYAVERQAAADTTTGGELAAKAAKLGVEGLGEALSGLATLFGPANGRLNSGFGWDEDTYNKAKPHFQTALDKFIAAGKTLKDLFKFLIENYGAGIRPYAVKFAKEANLGANLSEATNAAATEGSQENGRAGDARAGTEAAPAADIVGEPGRGADDAGEANGGGLPDAGAGPRPDGGARKDAGAAGRRGADAGASDAAPERDRAGNRVPARGLKNPERAPNYSAPPGQLERKGSWRDTADRNVKIIELANELTQSGRQPTVDEQALLSQYVGFGSSEIRQAMFPVTSANAGLLIRPELAASSWREIVDRLVAAINPDEQATILRSTQYAHYTSEPIVRGIWDAVARMGFAGGKVLEPGMGIGNFPILAPASILERSSYTGVEMDHLTARIAGLLLPQESVVRGDYTQQGMPKDYFDLAIGNPPFSSTIIRTDPEYRTRRFMLHDYFFAKTIDRVRPGGLLVFVTSKGTMDKANSAARTYLAERADLLGAIRLPQTAFKANAGTEVVTDIIFLQKREPGAEASGPKWEGLLGVKAPDEQNRETDQQINEYFVRHPAMVLGTHAATGTMYRAGEYTVKPRAGESIEEGMKAALAKLPEGNYSANRAQRDKQAKFDSADRDFNPSFRKEGQVYTDDKGVLRTISGGAGIPLQSVVQLKAPEVEWLKDYAGVRDLVKAAQHAQLVDGDWEKALAALNRGYKAFVKKHGNILAFTRIEKEGVDEDGNATQSVSYRYKNKKLLRLDVEAPLVMMLEKQTEEDQLVPGRFLTGRSLKAPAVPKIETIPDALAVSLDQLGALDLDHVAELAGVPRADVIENLGLSVYENPEGGWELADAYLSGNVRDKLEAAEVAARDDKRFLRNVEALAKVQPRRLAAADIKMKLGMPWIPLDVLTDFTKELKIHGGRVTYLPEGNIWKVVVPGSDRTGRSPGERFATADRSPVELLEAVMNNSPIKITRTGADKKTYPDEKATAAANEAAKNIRDEFASWVWLDAKRAERLLDLYNRQFNSIAPRVFNGDHLTFPGLSLRYTIRPHQKRAIWRIIQSGNTYIAHAVGAGKTLEMIIAGMEQKRLGLIRKPSYVVPNHMLEQFSNEFMEAYPAASILVADEHNFDIENRARFAAMTSLNNPDAVIITHSGFGKLETTHESRAAALGSFLMDLNAAIMELEKDADQRITRSKLEKQKEALEQRIEGKTTANKDKLLTFEQLGIDFLFVDEAHEFRKLDFATNQGQVKGITPTGSARAIDLYVKSQWLETQRPGRALVMASGTPITNTMAELFTVERFMAGQLLRDLGIHHFDAWAAQHGEIVATYEPNAAGRYEQVERFAKFVNVADMMARVRSFMDVVTMQQLGELVPRPKLIGGEPANVLSERSRELAEYMAGELTERIETSKAWKPSPSEKGNPDPIINIITDGRLAAIDMRFVDPAAGNDPTNKLNKMVDAIIAEYKAGKAREFIDHETGKPDPTPGSSQIVFSAVGFGEQVAKNRGFDVRGFVMDRLKAGGIPSSEVAWMGDYTSHSKKGAMFKEMKAGTKRILFGSPKNMGTGLNIQKRLSRLHYLAPPWYPADVEQPHGRILRQGNQNEEVGINWYATKGTYDATQWAMVARKGRFIEQALAGDNTVREIDDVGEVGQYEMAAALAAGDERIIELAKGRNELQRLNLLESAHYSAQSELRYTVSRLESLIKNEREKLKRMADAVTAAQLPKNYAAVTLDIGGKTLQIGRTEDQAGQRVYSAILEALGTFDHGGRKSAKELLGKVMGQWPLELHLDRSTFGKDTFVGAELTLTVGDLEQAFEFDGRTDLSTTAWENNVKPDGLNMRIVNMLNKPHAERSMIERGVTEDEQKLAGATKKLGAPFEFANKLAQLTAEVAQIERELANEGAAAADIAKQVKENRATPPAAPPSTSTPAPDEPAYLDSGPTTSPAFKSWFGNSKVVADGAPRVVYHGTAEDFFAFKQDRAGAATGHESASLGFFFTESKSEAKHYAENASDGVPMYERVVDVYLSLQRPFPTTTAALRKLDSPEAVAAFRARLVAQGFDGVQLTDAKQWVAFQPGQIKAPRNHGSFDPNNPDIRFQQARDEGGRFSPAGWDAVAGRDDVPGPMSVASVQAAIAGIKLDGVTTGGYQVTVLRNVGEIQNAALRERVEAGHPTGTDGIRGMIAGKAIYLFADNLTSAEQAEETLLHEAQGHAGIRMYLGADAFRLLSGIARAAGGEEGILALARRNGIQLDHYASRMAEDPAMSAPARLATLVEETIAFMAQRGEPTLKQRALELLGAVRAWLREHGFARLAAFNDADLARLVSRARDTAQGTPPRGGIAPAGEVAFSEAPPSRSGAALDAMERALQPAAIKDLIKDKTEDWRPSWLAALTMSHLEDLAGKLMPQIGEYNGVVKQMAADRNGIMQVTAKTADKWTDLMGRDAAAAAKMAELMHDTTIAGVDPSAAFVPGRTGSTRRGPDVQITPAEIARRIAMVVAERALTENPERWYQLDQEVLRLRESLATEQSRRTAFPELVARWTDLPRPAQQLYVEVRKAYEAMSAATLQALVTRIMGMEIANDQKLALTERLRLRFEEARIQAPYFPLARFGDFWVSSLNPEGAKEFAMYETHREWKRAQADLARAGHTNIDAGRKIATARAIDGATGHFVSEVQSVLEAAGVDKDVQDEVYQLYLRVLPDLSTRKHFIHRKKVAGFSQDALRAFGGNMFHGAHQVARLKHTHQLDRLMGEMRDKPAAIVNPDQSQRAAALYNEMTKRHEWVLNPRDSKTISQISSLSFVYYLGLTPAAGVVNLTQMLVTGMPVLGSRYGFGAASAALAKATKQAGRYLVKGDLRDHLTPEEQQAYDTWLAEGTIDVTQAHALAALSETDSTQFNQAQHKAMQVVSYAFHKSEVLNRQATALAAYRLARAAGKNAAEATEYAAKATWEAHFDYSNANRARFMQSGAAKILLQFRQYALNMTWYLARNAWQAMKGLDVVERTEARKKLAGTLGMTALFAGALGLPAAWAVFGVLNALHALGDDDEPWDAETAFQNWLADTLGADVARTITKGIGNGVFGVDLHSRTSLNNLWLREADAQLEGKDQYDYWLEQAAGPVGGLVANQFVAAKLVREGQIARAIETAMPKAVKDGLKALRFATQGVNTLRGDPLVEDVNPGQVMAQALGFTPAEVADRYDANRAVKDFEQQVLNQRGRLLDAYALSIRMEDEDAAARAIEKITAFNASNPDIPITAQTVETSMRSRARYAARAEDGISVNPHLSERARAQGAFAGE